MAKPLGSVKHEGLEGLVACVLIGAIADWKLRRHYFHCRVCDNYFYRDAAAVPRRVTCNNCHVKVIPFLRDDPTSRIVLTRSTYPHRLEIDKFLGGEFFELLCDFVGANRGALAEKIRRG